MPLIADCYEIALHGTTGGRPFTNVFHLELLGGTPPPIEEAAQIVADAYGTTIFDYTCTTTDLTGASYVDLRTLDGASGSIALSPPYSGGNSAAAAPPNVAVLLHWAATGGRAYRNGRTYVPGIGEGSVDPDGVLGVTQVGEFTVQCGEFMDALAVGELGLAVLSRVSPTEGIVRTVTEGTCDSRVATQRRRLRR